MGGAINDSLVTGLFRQVAVFSFLHSTDATLQNAAYFSTPTRSGADVAPPRNMELRPCWHYYTRQGINKQPAKG